MEAIQFEKVYFSYEREESGAEAVFSESSAFALDGIDLSIQQGEFVAVLGHNGSGKSTLARLTNGLLNPSSGKITVLGMDASDSDLLFEIRKRVGIVFQNPDNQTVATIVEDDIAFGPENIGLPREEIGKRIDFALNAVGMQAYRHATTSRLSGGQKQRIAIAGVLALKPEIMILDESTAMLDPIGRKEVMEVVLRLNKEEGITVVLITHFPEEAMLADRAIVMDHGAIVMQGKPSEILSNEEELKKYSLALPKPLRIARALRNAGLPVADDMSADGLAERIVSAIDSGEYELQIPNTTGAGTRSITESDRKTGWVECKNLHFVYNPSSPFATPALRGVDLEIPAGEFYGILGATGSGKSTFVQHLNALLKVPTAEKKYRAKKPRRGKPLLPKTELKVSGFDLTKKKTDFKELRRRVGMVFQYPEYQLFAETVFEDVAFGLKNFTNGRSQKEIETAVRDALTVVGLDYDAVKDKSPFDLSGGQKRRVAIAGVVVNKPEILVLDEPAAGLDPLGKEEIMTLLHALKRRWCKTVIVVSHDMDEIAENCTGAACFANGEIVIKGTPKTLFSAKTQLQKAGMDLPFTAKVVESLAKKGVVIACDFTIADFVEKVLLFAQDKGAGTRSTIEQGGGDDA